MKTTILALSLMISYNSFANQSLNESKIVIKKEDVIAAINETQNTALEGIAFVKPSFNLNTHEIATNYKVKARKASVKVLADE